MVLKNLKKQFNILEAMDLSIYLYQYLFQTLWDIMYTTIVR